MTTRELRIANWDPRIPESTYFRLFYDLVMPAIESGKSFAYSAEAFPDRLMQVCTEWAFDRGCYFFKQTTSSLSIVRAVPFAHPPG